MRDALPDDLFSILERMWVIGSRDELRQLAIESLRVFPKRHVTDSIIERSPRV